MARRPVLEQAFGQDRLARLHRLVGFTSFNLMLAHVVLITWGYAAGDLAATPGDALEPDRRLPRHAARRRRHARAGHGRGHQHQGGAAQAALRVLAPDPPLRLPRRRARPAAPAVDRPDFISSPGRDGLLVDGLGRWPPGPCWSGASACRCGATLRHGLRVTAVVPEGRRHRSVYVTGRRLHRLPRRGRPVPRPGGSSAGRGWTRANPYSLSAAPDGRSLRITVKDVGDGSAGLPHLRPGTRVLVEGPYGRLTDRARTRDRRSRCIGAGVGITPLRALAEGLDVRPGRRGDAPALHRRAALRRASSTCSPASAGLRSSELPGPPPRRRTPGSATASAAPTTSTALRHWVPDLAERDVYVCGPAAWTDAVRPHDLRPPALPADRFHVETFSW